MKDSSVLKKRIAFDITESEAMVEYLEGMALQGWKLARIGRNFHFEKIEPQKLRYFVQTVSKEAADELKMEINYEMVDEQNDAPSEEKSDRWQSELRTRGDWTLLCVKRRRFVYVSELEEPAPIAMNERDNLENIAKSLFGGKWLLWLFGCLWLGFMLLVNFFGHGGMLAILSSYGAMVLTLLLIAYFVFLITRGISLPLWFIRQKHGLQKSARPAPVSFKKQQRKFRIRRIFAWILVALLLAKPLQLLPLLLIKPELDEAHGQYFHSAAFLASRDSYFLTLEDSEMERVIVVKSDFDFVLDWYVYAETHEGFYHGTGYYREDDPSPFDAKRVFANSYAMHLVYDDFALALYPPWVLPSPAQVEEILQIVRP